MRDNMSYWELLQWFPPRPILSEAQYGKTQEVIDALIDKGDLSPDEEEYLDLLGTLLYTYEEQHVDIPDIWGVELIKAFLSERQLRQKELVPIFKTESIVSAVLNGHRKLTVEHIEKLAEFFNLALTPGPSLWYGRGALTPNPSPIPKRGVGGEGRFLSLLISQHLFQPFVICACQSQHFLLRGLSVAQGE